VVQPREDRAYTIVSEAINRSDMGHATLAPRLGMSAEVPLLRERPLLPMKGEWTCPRMAVAMLDTPPSQRFLLEKGDLFARVEGSYDWRLTQKLILQPRAELEFAAQDVREREIGSGPSSAEFGLRLRYEIRRPFAPYVGVSYERALGRTADLARAHGEAVDSTRVVLGLRAFF
jgi:hypothetical protein